MPQVFNVLKCYKCNTFQVQQEKKSNKWQCKMCGEKQSVKRVYGTGTGYECRQHVQRLNILKGDAENFHQSKEADRVQFDDGCSEYGEIFNDEESDSEFEELAKENTKPSRWDKFMNTNDDFEANSRNDTLSSQSFTRFDQTNGSINQSVITSKVDEIAQGREKGSHHPVNPFKITTDINFDF